MKRNRPTSPPVQAPSTFAGFRFPPVVILLAVRWYLRYPPSYREMEEILAKRGIDAAHVTLFRWVQRFTPELIDAARPRRHAVGDRWFVDEAYVKVNRVWRCVYRAVDQHGGRQHRRLVHHNHRYRDRSDRRPRDGSTLSAYGMGKAPR